MTLPYCDGPEFTCLDAFVDMPKKLIEKYGVMSIPGKPDDDDHCCWLVVHIASRKSKTVGYGERARIAAYAETARLNATVKK